MENFISRAHGWEGHELRIYQPNAEEWNVAHWSINGFPTRVVIWTSEEWSRLKTRPRDAQYLPCGLWCAIRVGE